MQLLLVVVQVPMELTPSLNVIVSASGTLGETVAVSVVLPPDAVGLTEEVRVVVVEVRDEVDMEKITPSAALPP